jgi:tetratricopeptide (TPR) repeat protein
LTDLHLSRGLLRAVVRGQRPVGEVAIVALAHLFVHCPRCRAEFEAFQQEQKEAGTRPRGYAAAYERALARVSAEAGRVATAREGAAETLEGLLSLPAGERLEAIRSNPDRFAGPALAELLLERVRDCLPGYPRDAFLLARMAQAVLQHSPSSPYAVELYARALAQMGNARRVEGELEDADERLAQARFLLASHGPADRAAEAELDHLEGSLRRDERRLTEAVELLRRAVASYRQEGRRIEAARVLLTLGTVHREEWKLAEAILVTREALEALSIDEEPQLHLFGRHNLARLYCDLEEYREARRIVDESRPIYRRFANPLTLLRLEWLEGHIARGLGDREAAEAAYQAVREGFLLQGIGYDAALAALDLAALLLEQGRTVEVKALTEALVPLFAVRGVRREASMALRMLVDAARAERLTIALLGEVSRYLESARHNPRLPFRPSS